ncbi:hypothetical protein N9W84_01015 [bacterium]|nr:hypothetical protein [bacterium]
MSMDYKIKRPTLDLHGAMHHEVIGICSKFINKNFGKELKIITGNSDKMKEIVIEIIISYNLEYRIGDYINFGYIVVYS